MEETKQSPSQTPSRGADGHLMTCKHDGNCCVVPDKMLGRIGKRWATSLSGFISGVIVASIVLIPWMVFQKTLVEEACFERVPPPMRSENILDNDAVIQEDAAAAAAGGTVLEGSEQSTVEDAPIQ